MAGELGERVTALEHEMQALKEVVARQILDKGWDNTFGMFANDPGYDELVRLGKEIREQDRENEV